MPRIKGLKKAKGKGSRHYFLQKRQDNEQKTDTYARHHPGATAFTHPFSQKNHVCGRLGLEKEIYASEISASGKAFFENARSLDSKNNGNKLVYFYSQR